MSAVGSPAEPPGPGDVGGFRLPAPSRIRGAADIRALHARGKHERTAHLDVFYAASPVSRPRFGVVVPKHRHTIVERNRVRRRLREIGRTEVLPRLHRLAEPLDLLVRARREAYGASFRTLRDELVAMMEATWSVGS